MSREPAAIFEFTHQLVCIALSGKFTGASEGKKSVCVGGGGLWVCVWFVCEAEPSG